MAKYHGTKMTIPRRDVKLWLDDLRPAPEGWVWCKTVDAAQFLMLHNVVEMSLDHDLGACSDCSEGLTPEQWLEKYNYRSMPHCSHVGTGVTFLNWVEAEKKWPFKKPTVHSANPVGTKNMRQIIDKYYDEYDQYNPTRYDR